MQDRKIQDWNTRDEMPLTTGKCKTGKWKTKDHNYGRALYLPLFDHSWSSIYRSCSFVRRRNRLMYCSCCRSKKRDMPQLRALFLLSPPQYTAGSENKMACLPVNMTSMPCHQWLAVAAEPEYAVTMTLQSTTVSSENSDNSRQRPTLFVLK